MKLNRRNRKYRAFKPWFWYIVPAPILLRFTRRYFKNQNFVWWQEIVDGQVVAELAYRKVYPDEATKKLQEWSASQNWSDGVSREW